MKVVLYAVRVGESCKACFSVAWEVDGVYWSHAAANEIIRVKEQLPLGIAQRVCRSLNERWGKSRNGDGAGARYEVDWKEEFSGTIQLVYGGMGGAFEVEKVALQLQRRYGSDLDKVAQLAGAYLAGRSLLREEAAQLLASVMPAEHSAGDDLAALQLAALTGALQLTAAVAPKPAAPPPSGFRALAERLRPARLFGLAASHRRPEELACRRCGSGMDKLRRTFCAACGQACAYCEACLTMGRSRECGLLIIGVPPAGAAAFARGSASASRSPIPSPPGSSHRSLISSSVGRSHRSLIPSPAGCSHCSLIPSPAECSHHSLIPSPAECSHQSPIPSPTALSHQLVPSTLSTPTASYSPNPSPATLAERWGLSPAQSAAAAEALQFLHTPSNERKGNSFLLWAVTGAGKTEMIFPLLEAILAQGGRALVATPRRDVVLELAPRLAKAFPHVKHSVLYGGSANRWENGALTLATTHQLMRFQESFELVLIDELDAFPYHNDPLLHHAADKCRRKSGTTVLLSATPPLQLQRAAARGNLPYARVPVRYHRHPLPVPISLHIPSISHLLRKEKLPPKLVQHLQHSISRGAQIFLFVPYVKQVEPVVRLLSQNASQLQIPPQDIAGTSSKDTDRTDKVTSFREQAIRLLVTTTILERGVTIPRSDVFILDAHNPLFDTASLVQMAGRAGRSAADPFGCVCFGAPSWSKSQRSSIRQIRSMNTLAKRHGYLQ